MAEMEGSTGNVWLGRSAHPIYSQPLDLVRSRRLVKEAWSARKVSQRRQCIWRQLEVAAIACSVQEDDTGQQYQISNEVSRRYYCISYFPQQTQSCFLLPLVWFDLEFKLHFLFFYFVTHVKKKKKKRGYVWVGAHIFFYFIKIETFGLKAELSIYSYV